MMLVPWCLGLAELTVHTVGNKGPMHFTCMKLYIDLLDSFMI